MAVVSAGLVGLGGVALGYVVVLFSLCHKLANLHLGVQALDKLPSFNGLSNLKTLALGLLVSLTELPSFDKLHKPERLTDSGLPRVDVFPDLTNVLSLVAFDRGALCRNGFLGADRCNFTRSLCQQHLSGAPAITQCLAPDRVASPATRANFDKFSLGAGTVKFSPRARRWRRTRQATGDAAAMHYNPRWMPVACDATPFPTKMRRQQIALGHGAPCDPVNEEWLGRKA